MLLQLQKYSLVVHYKKGKYMYLADTLSRAPLPEVQACEMALEAAEIVHTATLTLPAERLHEFQHASADDPVLCELRKTIQQGWPKCKSDISEALHAYYDFRHELTTEDQLVFKGPVLVVPAALRKVMMAACHDTHIGVEGCIRRARESMFWPRMATDLKTYISKCEVCMSHRTAPQKETMLPHEVTPRPWSKVGTDLCELHGRNLLVVCDYFSNFIEVENLQTTTTRAVCKVFRALFARYGVPDTLITDNGPQFSSAEFVTFTKVWSFEHSTSSPHYPQSNGKAENAVKTVKRLFTKCRESGQSEYRALLDWRNTPTEGVGTSPAQRFFGRRCKTLLPMTRFQLEPQYSTADDSRALKGQKAKQELYYNRSAKDLTPIPRGAAVRMRLPGQTMWTPGVCMGQCGPRSYKVRVGDRDYRRNRRQLVHSGEQPPVDTPYVEQSVTAEPVVRETDIPTEQQVPETLTSSGSESPTTTEVHTPDDPTPPTLPPLRRSERARRPPDWITNYASV